MDTQIIRECKEFVDANDLAGLQNHYMADCKAAQSREEAAGQARPWPPMPPHPSQLTAVAQLGTPQAPPLLPPVSYHRLPSCAALLQFIF